MAGRRPPLSQTLPHGPSLQTAATAEDARRDPVFLVMFTGQIESAEVSFMTSLILH